MLLLIYYASFPPPILFPALLFFSHLHSISSSTTTPIKQQSSLHYPRCLFLDLPPSSFPVVRCVYSLISSSSPISPSLYHSLHLPFHPRLASFYFIYLIASPFPLFFLSLFLFFSSSLIHLLPPLSPKNPLFDATHHAPPPLVTPTLCIWLFSYPYYPRFNRRLPPIPFSLAILRSMYFSLP